MAGTVMSDELSSNYYQRNEELFKNGRWHQEIAGLGLDFKNKTVLDLAAGTGHWEEVFISLGVKKVFWQDLSHYFYEIAKNRLKGYDNIEFFLEDMTGIPLENESVDFVMCRDSLYHSPDEKETLSEIYRVLRKDGYLYLTARNWRRVFREVLTWKAPLKLLSPFIYNLTGEKYTPTNFLVESCTIAGLRQFGFEINKFRRNDSNFCILAYK